MNVLLSSGCPLFDRIEALLSIELFELMLVLASLVFGLCWLLMLALFADTGLVGDSELEALARLPFELLPFDVTYFSSLASICLP